MSWHVKVIPNRYADSVKLMGIARALRGRDGVEGCEMGMGTAANLEMAAYAHAFLSQTAESLRQSNLAIDQLNGAARGLQTSVARFKLPE